MNAARHARTPAIAEGGDHTRASKPESPATGGLWGPFALKVAPVSDPLEREADQMAARVTAAAHDGAPSIQRKCASCLLEEEEGAFVRDATAEPGT